jgi:hypothetical protein
MTFGNFWQQDISVKIEMTRQYNTCARTHSQFEKVGSTLEGVAEDEQEEEEEEHDLSAPKPEKEGLQQTQTGASSCSGDSDHAPPPLSQPLDFPRRPSLTGEAGDGDDGSGGGCEGGGDGRNS